MTPIELKIEKATQIYQANRVNKNGNKNSEADTTQINWQHLADAAIRTHKEEEEDNPIQIFTDGSKSERGVGSGMAIYGRARTLRLYSVD
jgi:hypothetical protein